jgi:hypothetical protein
MKRTFIVLLCGLALACGKKHEDDKTTITSAPIAPAPMPLPMPTLAPTTPPAPPPPPEVEVSPEMKSFLSMLDGSDRSAARALAKYGSRANTKNALGMYSLRDPKVTKSETIGAMQCYTFEATAGAIAHVTRTCWDSSGKIAQINDRTMMTRTP